MTWLVCVMSLSIERKCGATHLFLLFRHIFNVIVYYFHATASRLLVGAIDFGTTYSGWAFSFQHDYDSDPTVANVKNWHAGTGNLVTEKTPTVLLVTPDGKTIQAFGYEAENQYRNLVDKNQHKDYYYFRFFKMELMKELGKGISRTFMLKEEMGKELMALDVFSMSIQFLKDDMMAIVETRLASTLQLQEIHWVLTVPAIWSDAAKQFMREAAMKAGISKENLTIALEPEAASMFCRHIPVGKTVDIKRESIAKLPIGSKYLVIDAGGGTVDITVHEVQSAHTLREVNASSGGAWGGRMVDHAFEMFLKEFIGADVYEDFKDNAKEDWFDLFREFECRKREVGVNAEGRVIMHFPSSLSDLYRQTNNIGIIDFLKESFYAESIEIKRDKIKFASELFQSFFSESVGKINDQLRSMALVDISTILLVGGYSESTLLQKAIREAFLDKQVVVPIGASSTLLRGALIFGHNPEIVTERILKYTYGIELWNNFKEGKHPKSKLKQTDTGDFCVGIFDKLLEINQRVKINETQYKHVFATRKTNMSGMLFDFYASKEHNPIFIDDKGCSHIGRILFYFEEPVVEVERCVSVSLMLRGTEIFVDVEDQTTGKKLSKSIDFLG